MLAPLGDRGGDHGRVIGVGVEGEPAALGEVAALEVVKAGAQGDLEFGPDEVDVALDTADDRVVRGLDGGRQVAGAEQAQQRLALAEVVEQGGEVAAQARRVGGLGRGLGGADGRCG